MVLVMRKRTEGVTSIYRGGCDATHSRLAYIHYSLSAVDQWKEHQSILTPAGWTGRSVLRLLFYWTSARGQEVLPKLHIWTAAAQLDV